ncbi:MAG TPA: NAD(P)-dependent oxidoreductase [Steroidobacteraceae bacterium]|jgi:glyoxylate/hydroxypyruvate reductase A
MTVLYQGSPARAGAWAQIFATEAPDLSFHLWPGASDLDAVEYLIAWHPPAELLASLPNLKVLFSYGAGVDHIGLSRVPSHVPIVRMVEAGLVSGMVEFVTMAVLALHRNIPDYISAQHAGVWRPMDSVPATARRLGVMGLGVLGQAVLAALSPFGFSLNGWSRTPKDVNPMSDSAARKATRSPEHLIRAAPGVWIAKWIKEMRINVCGQQGLLTCSALLPDLSITQND